MEGGGVDGVDGVDGVVHRCADRVVLSLTSFTSVVLRSCSHRQRPGGAQVSDVCGHGSGHQLLVRHALG